MERTPRHDMVVIGGSTGAAQVLQTILNGLPPNLPASVLIVMHPGASRTTVDLLKVASMLPVRLATDGAEVEPGVAYLAPRDRHLLLHDRHLLTSSGPRENLCRPAIDALFRSAACSFGGRVVGVLLSGVLNDGSAGLAAVKRCGGLVVVQDPDDAEAPDMPRRAMRAVDVDHVVPATEMAELVARLVSTPAGPTPAIPLSIRLEAAIAAQEPGAMNVEDQLGARSPFSCPECGGPMWEVDDRPLRYRCHIGHALTADTLILGQSDEIERKLNQLVRVHAEHAEVLTRAAKRERATSNDRLADFLEQRAKLTEQDAALLRSLLGKSRVPASEY